MIKKHFLLQILILLIIYNVKLHHMFVNCRSVHVKLSFDAKFDNIKDVVTDFKK